MKFLLALLWLFALIDLGLSLHYLDARCELNPLAAWLFHHGAAALAAVKLAITSGSTVVLWIGRHGRIALFGAAVCVGVYAVIAIEWGRFVFSL